MDNLPAASPATRLLRPAAPPESALMLSHEDGEIRIRPSAFPFQDWPLDHTVSTLKAYAFEAVMRFLMASGAYPGDRWALVSRQWLEDSFTAENDAWKRRDASGYIAGSMIEFDHSHFMFLHFLGSLAALDDIGADELGHWYWPRQGLFDRMMLRVGQ